MLYQRALGLTLTALLGLFLATSLEATTFVRLHDEDLTDQARFILEGTVLEVDAEAGLSRPATHYTIQVERVLAGGEVPEELVVRVPGGRTPEGLTHFLYGAPRFSVGERLLLFLSLRGDGTHSVLHFQQGVFRFGEVEGTPVLFRAFGGAQEIPGLRQLPPEGPRHQALFLNWLEDRLQGIERPADYLTDLPTEPLLADAADKFTFITVGGFPTRWREFDNGQAVRFRADSTGQDGLPNGGFNELRNALQLWTNEPNTNVRYVYAGTIGSRAGFTFDGVNLVSFSDPQNDLGDPFTCITGGVLAAAGPWTNGTTHTFRGERFTNILEADMVTNRGIACTVGTDRVGEEVFAHEFGHTLGLSHSCGDGPSGPCNTGRKDDALMRAFVHGDNRGASLRADDREGLAVLYSGGGSPPNSPNNLTATATGPGEVVLQWNDTSNNETQFEVERRLEGVETEFAELAALDQDTTTFTDSTASSGLEYTYRVRARNGAGTSGYSNQALVATPGELAPTDFTALPRGGTQVDLAWVDQATGETAYEVEVRAQGEEDFSLLAELPADSTSFSTDALDNSTTYSFRVRTTGGVGTSAYTPAASVTTACVASDDTLCLQQERFRVRARFEDFIGRTGLAEVAPIPSPDSGVLYFFEADNWEFLVKVINGCGQNDHFWVFAAATTNLAYELEVTDTWTNETRVYSNALGESSPAFTENLAFPTCDATAPGTDEVMAPAVEPQALATAPAREKVGPCVPDATTVCLNGGRFQVEVDWQDFVGNVGQGEVVPASLEVPGVDDSALLFFFRPANWEMLIKVIDGCGFNDHFWVFSAATTNVEYTVRVTDVLTGEERIYDNQLGVSADAVTDNRAFATCP